MRMAHDFAPARAVARHCPELLARGPRPGEREAQVAAWRRDVAGRLAERVGDLLSGDRLSAEVGAPEWLCGAEVFTRIGPVAANSLLRCGSGRSDAGAGVLLSLDHATALALAERSFGGEGRVGEPSEAPLPRSAVLMSDEIARRIAEALAAARRGDADADAGTPLSAEVMLRSENAARLRPFDPADRCALLALRLANQHGCVWQARLAVSEEALQHLLPEPGAANAAERARQGASPDASFGAIPLGVRAVLAEIGLTLGQLSRLAPGDTIPLAMPRAVPLRIGDALLGHGSIGTLDDRMALRVTSLSHQGPTP